MKSQLTNEILNQWGVDVDLVPDWLLAVAAHIADISDKKMKLGEVLVEDGVLSEFDIKEALATKKSSTQLGNHLLDIYSGQLSITNAIIPAIAVTLKSPYFKNLSDVGLGIHSSLSSIDVAKECEDLQCVICVVADVNFIVFPTPDLAMKYQQMGLGDKESSMIYQAFEKKGMRLITAFASLEHITTELNKLDSDIEDNEVNISEIRASNLVQAGGTSEKLAKIMAECLNHQATDLHIQPAFIGDGVNISMRIKGNIVDLKTQFQLNKEEYFEIQGYLSRATHATHNDAPIYTPTDGKAVTYIGNQKKVRLRTSFMPKGIFSDVNKNPVRIVIRFMNYDSDIIELESLGLDSRALKYLKEAIELKGKLSLMVGPMGSGKSTTQYAALMAFAQLNKGKSIVSIEDPIEQYIPNVDQVQISDQSIKLGYGYAYYLKYFLRQDSNCIYIGEIRDHETALASASFSSVGNKIFSTLHGQDENDGLQRLMSMMPKDDEKFMLINNISHIFTQRLIPQLCSCKSKLTLSEDDYKKELIKIERWLTKAGEKSFSSYFSKEKEGNIEFYKKNPSGCQKCNYIGISSVKPVIGVLDFTSEVKTQLLSRAPERFENVRGLRPLTIYDQIIPMVINGDADIESINQ